MIGGYDVLKSNNLPLEISKPTFVSKPNVALLDKLIYSTRASGFSFNYNSFSAQIMLWGLLSLFFVKYNSSKIIIFQHIDY